MIDRSHELPLTRQAAVLKLGRSGLYYRPRPASPADLGIMRRIDDLHLDYPFAGSRMLRDLLRGEGIEIGRQRVATLMRRMGVEAIYRRPNTSKPALGHKIYPYLLRSVSIGRPNQVWAMDITYIPMARGFVYLCAVVDWFSRRVLAWRLSITLEVGFCLEAVDEALAKHARPEIFNTDQGSQFTSAEFTGLLLKHAIAISKDAKGSWRDNVFVERLWRPSRVRGHWRSWRRCSTFTRTRSPTGRRSCWRARRACSGKALALAVERQVKPVLAEQDHRQQSGAGAAASDRVKRRRRLGDPLARPAAELLADGLDHLPLPGNDLQRLGHILAELDQPALTARADGGWRDDDALARQMATGPAPACAGRSFRPRSRSYRPPRPRRHGRPRWRSLPVPRVAAPTGRAAVAGAPTTARTDRASAWRSSASDAPPWLRRRMHAPRPRSGPNARRGTPLSASRYRRERSRVCCSLCCSPSRRGFVQPARAGRTV